MPTTIDDILTVARAWPGYDDFVFIPARYGTNASEPRVFNKWRVLVNVYRAAVFADGALSDAERLAYIQAIGNLYRHLVWLGETVSLGVNLDAFLARLNAAIASCPTGDQLECYAILRRHYGLTDDQWTAKWWPRCQAFAGGPAAFVASFKQTSFETTPGNTRYEPVRSCLPPPFNRHDA